MQHEEVVYLKILLFGVSQVGKSSVAKAISEKLNIKFCDIDYLLIDEFGSVEKFQKIYEDNYERYKFKTDYTLKICEKYDDVVIAVSPIYSYELISKFLINKELKCFNLTANISVIFERMGFYNEKGEYLEDSELYKELHKTHYMNEIRFDNSANHDVFRDIPRINTSKKTIEEVADCIIEKCKIKRQ